MQALLAYLVDSCLKTYSRSATTCYVALHPQVKGISGKYFSNCNLDATSSQANDAQLAEKLWNFTENLIKENQPGSR
ncbi:putative very-long-chain 3-oxoacyl-CoA reductase [Helianthus debilis subsp. tardiflorus]